METGLRRETFGKCSSMLFQTLKELDWVKSRTFVIIVPNECLTGFLGWTKPFLEFTGHWVVHCHGPGSVTVRLWYTQYGVKPVPAPGLPNCRARKLPPDSIAWSEGHRQHFLSGSSDSEQVDVNCAGAGGELSLSLEYLHGSLTQFTTWTHQLKALPPSPTLRSVSGLFLINYTWPWPWPWPWCLRRSFRTCGVPSMPPWDAGHGPHGRRRASPSGSAESESSSPHWETYKSRSLSKSRGRLDQLW